MTVGGVEGKVFKIVNVLNSAALTNSNPRLARRPSVTGIGLPERKTGAGT